MQIRYRDFFYAVCSILFVLLTAFLTKTSCPWAGTGYLLLSGFFCVDLILARRECSSFGEFLRKNAMQIAALLPFHPILGMLRFIAVTRILRGLGLIPSGSDRERAWLDVRSYLIASGFLNLLYFSVGAVLFGAIGITFFEDKQFLDGLWWSLVTLSTVGYGDISPSTSGGRIVAAVLILTGIGVISSLTGTITGFFLRDRRPSCQHDKVQMVLTMYESLNDLEKKEFKRLLSK